MHKHFDDKDARTHVLEKRIEGMKEVHGTELPGHFASFTDSLKETSLFLLIFSLFITQIFYLLLAALGWLLWRMGRSARLGWARLERLHRLIEQEKFEIEHHRPQERDELLALYREKGFHGKLLDDVVDVLMADEDRLLKVMLEEEMGLTLEAYEHPLKQALGSGLGVILASLIFLPIFYFFPLFGGILAGLFGIALGAFLNALSERNKIVPAIVWNVSFGVLAFGLIYLIIKITTG